MKKLMLRALPALALAAFAVGCQEKPELSFSEYGETLPCLPRVENLPKNLPYPAELEPSRCKFKDEADERLEKNLRENEEKLQAVEQKRNAK